MRDDITGNIQVNEESIVGVKPEEGTPSYDKSAENLEPENT